MIRLFVWLVELCHRRALAAVAVFGLLTAFAVYYAATHLGITTNTDQMLDSNLPFLKEEREFRQAFPQFTDVLVIVVDAKDSVSAESAADAIAAKLGSRPDLFPSVYQPGRGKFFDRNGLLYLDEEELWKLNERLAAAGPWLGRLSHDPSLAGLFSVLAQAVGRDLSPQHQGAITKVLGQVAQVVEAQAGGRERDFSWQTAMLGENEVLAGPSRQFVLTQPRLDFSNMQAGKDALDIVHGYARSLEQSPAYEGLNIRLTGSVAMEDEELASVSDGAEWSTALSFILVCIILVLALRSPRPVIAIALTLLVGLSWTAAFAAWAVGSLNLISVSFAVLFIGLGVDFGIQFAMRYREELNRGAPPGDALRLAAQGVGGALALAAVAAAACFFAFIPTSYRGLAELGMISGVGMFVALFANLTLLPALLTLLPVRPVSHQTALGGAIQSWVRSKRSHAIVLWIAAALVAIGLSVLPWTSFDFNPLNLRDPKTESVSTFYDLLRNSNTTPYTVDVLARDLAAADGLAKELAKRPLVDKAVTLSSYVPVDQDAKLAVIEDLKLVLGPSILKPASAPAHTYEETLASVRALGAALKKANGDAALKQSAGRLTQALDNLLSVRGSDASVLDELEERLIGGLVPQLDKLRQLVTAERFTLKDLPQDLKLRYVAEDGRARIQVFPKEDLTNNEALKRFVDDVSAVTPKVSGTPVTMLEAGRAIIRACLEASLVAVAAIFVVLLIALRRLSDALLVLAPLALAALLTTTGAVLVGIDFDLANLIALPLLVGIGVAFGIYLVHRFRAKSVLSEAMNSSTPQAIFYSALTTMASFGTLAFSQHRGMSGMGQLLTMALTFALLCTLLILPALLGLREKRSSSRAD